MRQRKNVTNCGAECYRTNSGLTLLELAIAVTLLGLVSLSFGVLYASSHRHLVRNTNLVSAQSEASFALEHIRKALFLATDVTTPAEEGPNGDQLVFTSQPNPPAGPVITSTYQLTGSDITYSDGGAPVVIARSINNVDFSRLSRYSVGVEITAERTAGGDTQSTQLTSIITPRGIL